MFQGIYNWIRNFKTPIYIKNMLKDIQDLIISSFTQIGKDYIEGLRNKITEVQNKNWPDWDKLKFVFDWGKKNIPDVKDISLNIVIQILLFLLKKNSFMRIV